MPFFLRKLGVIGTPVAPTFGALGSEFDGTNDFADRGSDLTGNANGKQGIISVWMYLDALDGRRIISSAGDFFRIDFSGSAQAIQVIGKNSAGATILDIQHAATLTINTWYHYLVSWDLAVGGSGRVYLNDADSYEQDTYTDDTIDYTRTDWRFGGQVASSLNRWGGRLAEVYVNLAEYLDFDTESNRRKFIDVSGNPVDLGADGSTPTGTAPLVYFSRRTGDTPDAIAVNRGTGGAFTLTGTLADGGTPSVSI